MPLQAVILAAGYGRRMQPLTEHCHKALLPVGGTTILGRMTDALVQVGVERVTVVTGYRAGDVVDFLQGSYPDLDLRFVDNARFAETNNIVSLSVAFDVMEFDADVILMECDLLFDASLLERLVHHPAPNVALVDRYRTGMDGTVVAMRDGVITEVHPTDTQGPDFSYNEKYKTLNIYRFDREFCRTTFRPLLNTYANEIDSSCYYELVLGMLTNVPSHRIFGEVVEGERWAEVDDPTDLAASTFLFQPERRAELLDRTFGGHWRLDVLDFSFMRNVHFPTGAMLAGMRWALPELVSSYGSSQPVLNEKLGYFLRCDSGRVQVLHGASQAFPILARIFAGRSVAIPNPTFGEYRRAFPDALRYADSPGVEWTDLESHAGSRSVVVVVNPNSPTGTTLRSKDVLALAQSAPDTLFCVDESFLAFTDEPSLVTLLEDHPVRNVLVLVSLSKSLGVPGLRLGYVYSSNPGLIDAIGAELPVWNLSSPAEFFLELMLKFTPSYQASLRQVVVDRDNLREDLGRVPVVRRVHESGGNFLLVELRGDGPEVAQEVRAWLLAETAIEVKDVSGRFGDLRPRLRVAVRGAEDNGRLVEAMSGLPISLWSNER